jgi:hypothetical protein
MTQPNSTPNKTFDDLFSRLLSTVAEEDNVKASGGTFTALIEVRERLQALRLDLAAVRNRLVTEGNTRLSNPQPPRYDTSRRRHGDQPVARPLHAAHSPYVPLWAGVRWW